MQNYARITLDPAVLAGKPVIKGTRLAVDFIIGLLAEGGSEADILQNYPGIAREDFAACLLCARYSKLGKISECGVTCAFLPTRNFPGAAVEAIRARGHDIIWVRTGAH